MPRGLSPGDARSCQAKSISTISPYPHLPLSVHKADIAVPPTLPFCFYEKTRLGAKGYQGCIRYQDVQEGTWDRNLEADSEAEALKEECCLLACSAGFSIEPWTTG